jgi:hypothetical protein
MRFAPFIAITAAANAAFILGLAAMLSWQECLMVALAAALAGGAVFTFQEMHRLAKEGN